MHAARVCQVHTITPTQQSIGEGFSWHNIEIQSGVIVGREDCVEGSLGCTCRISALG